jgi:hypothetical protein
MGRIKYDRQQLLYLFRNKEYFYLLNLNPMGVKLKWRGLLIWIKKKIKDEKRI